MECIMRVTTTRVYIIQGVREAEKLSAFVSDLSIESGSGVTFFPSADETISSSFQFSRCEIPCFSQVGLIYPWQQISILSVSHVHERNSRKIVGGVRLMSTTPSSSYNNIKKNTLYIKYYFFLIILKCILNSIKTITSTI